MPDWKGMFKKGTELAQQAKSEIEKSGLLDQVRQATSSGSTTDAPVPPAPPADAAAEVRQVLRPDQPDPFTLVRTADVSAAFGGAPAQGPRATYSDSSGGPAWTVATSAGEVTVDVHLYADPYDIHELLGYGDDQIQRLRDVEDRAAIAGDMAALQRGGETLTISVSGPATGTYAAVLEHLLRVVSPRLPSFSSYAARMALPGGPVVPDILTREVLAEIMGVPFDVPSFNRDDNELEIVWPAMEVPRDAYGDPGEPTQVSVTCFVVDPWDLQKQQADAGGVWAKAAVEIGEAMKEQYSDLIKPVPGPWDEGYLGADEAYFKKSGRSYKIKIAAAVSDTTEQVAALAQRLAAAV